MSLDELKTVATEVGAKPFVGKQIAEWIYGKKVKSFDQMTNLSKNVRAKLTEHFTIGCSAPLGGWHGEVFVCYRKRGLY